MLRATDTPSIKVGWGIGHPWTKAALTVAQMKKLQEVILKACLQNEADKQEIKDDEFLKLFSDAKRVEGEFWQDNFIL